MTNVIGVLTAGGDCPGLNAVIRAVVARATERHDAEVVGILNGWEGLMQGRTRSLDRDSVRGILARGGTIEFRKRFNDQRLDLFLFLYNISGKTGDPLRGLCRRWNDGFFNGRRGLPWRSRRGLIPWESRRGGFLQRPMSVLRRLHGHGYVLGTARRPG